MLFICNSPFHLLNAINYRLNISPNCDADCILINMFRDAEKTYDNLKKSGLFDHVYYCSDSGNNRKIQVWESFFPQKYIKNNFPDFPLGEKKYKKIVVATYLSVIALSICRYFNQKGVSIDFIEDGTGTYVYGLPKMRVSDDLWEKVYCKLFPITPTNVYLYDQSLLQIKPRYPVKDFCKMNKDTNTIAAFNRIYPSVKPIQKEYIFIFESDIYGITTEDQLLILKDLADIVGKQNIVVKPHPKTDIKLLQDFELLDGSVPWEIYCLNSDMSGKTLAVMNSTAAFTPTMIFSDTTRLIFMNEYPIFDGCDFATSCKIIQKKFQAIHPEVLIKRVGSKEELCKIL